MRIANIHIYGGLCSEPPHLGGPRGGNCGLSIVVP